MGMIMARPGGVQEFNSTIISALREWLLKTAKELLELAANMHDTKLLTGVGKLEKDLGSRASKSTWRSRRRSLAPSIWSRPR